MKDFNVKQIYVTDLGDKIEFAIDGDYVDLEVHEAKHFAYLLSELLKKTKTKETQEITMHNIEQVLYYNGYTKGYTRWIDSNKNAGITIGNENNYVKVCFISCYWLETIEAFLGTKLTPLPEKPRNLVEWVRYYSGLKNSVNICDNSEYVYELVISGEFVLQIPKKWDLDRQIKAVKELIKIYKDLV